MNFDSRAWMIWIAVAAAIVIVARNPLYALTMLAVTLIVTAAFRRTSADEQGLSLVRVGALILIFSAFYNALFVHVGETVILTLPDWPLIGGEITLEAMVEGASNGLTLIALLAVFIALNAIVPTNDLVRLVPVALHDLGLVVLIAVTYIPETRRHLKRIREAQAIRGHELHGFRDWQPLVIPLLVGGLERAMRLADTMVSRGYGATHDNQSSTSERMALIGGLSLALTGWILVIWQGDMGWLAILAGFSILSWLLWRRGRKKSRTSYSPNSWRIRDWLILVGAIVALVVVFALNNLVYQSTLSYSPYPQLSLPAFDWRIGLAMALMVLPVAIFFVTPSEGQRDTQT